METTDTINIAYDINATITDVWKAWTDSSLVLKWFGSDLEGAGIEANLNVQPGGSFEVSFKNADGAAHTCYGVYAEVIEPNKLSFTWAWKSEPGVESFVTVLLEPKGKTTQMQFQHAHVGHESAHDYEFGWKSTFQKLERVLSQINS
jgi:uncharacterized protein YndB with AHSA1/START domain